MTNLIPMNDNLRLTILILSIAALIFGALISTAGCGTVSDFRSDLYATGDTMAKATADVLGKYQAKTIEACLAKENSAKENNTKDRDAYIVEMTSQGKLEDPYVVWKIKQYEIIASAIDSDIEYTVKLKERADAAAQKK